jgi:hypothetical protein
VEDLATFKDRAIAVPWLLSQKTELVKLYFSWISVCRVLVIDWEQGINEEVLFLQDELEECLERVDGSKDTSFFHVADIQVSILTTAISWGNWWRISNDFSTRKKKDDGSGMPWRRAIRQSATTGWIVLIGNGTYQDVILVNDVGVARTLEFAGIYSSRTCSRSKMILSDLARRINRFSPRKEALRT